MKRRLSHWGYTLSILLGVVTLVFFLFRIQPGDPARMMAGQFADEETLENIRHNLGLDLPWHKQYLRYLNDLSPLSVYGIGKASWLPVYEKSERGGYVLHAGERRLWALKWPYLGRSFQSGRSVNAIIREAFPGTMILAVSAMGLALLTGIALGVWTSMRAGRIADQVVTLCSALGMSAPSFFMAILIAWLGGFVLRDNIPLGPGFFGIFLVIIAFQPPGRSGKRGKRGKKWTTVFLGLGALCLVWGIFGTTAPWLNLPGTGLKMTGSWTEVHPFEGEIPAPRNLILPMVTLGIRPLAVIVQLTRNSLLSEFRKEYIRTARSKGLGPGYIVWRHALPNALNPVITAVSGWFASMLAGAVFIEYIFGWRGLGLEIYEALERNDLPVIMGMVLLFSVIFVFINFLVDLIYPLLDPRLRSAT